MSKRYTNTQQDVLVSLFTTTWRLRPVGGGYEYWEGDARYMASKATVPEILQLAADHLIIALPSGYALTREGFDLAGAIRQQDLARR